MKANEDAHGDDSNSEPLEELKPKKEKAHKIEEFKPVHETVPKFGLDDSTLPPLKEPVAEKKAKKKIQTQQGPPAEEQKTLESEKPPKAITAKMIKRELD